MSDLKVHARRVHQTEMETLPPEFYSENNGYWCSIHPADYSKLVRPTSRANPAAVKMRTAVLDWTKRMGSKSTKSRQAFLEDWQKTESGQAFTLTSVEEEDSFDYFDVEDEPKLVYINMIPGAIFVDIEKGLDKFRLLIDDNLFKDTPSLRSLSRRMSSLSPSSLPFGAVDLQEDRNEEHRNHLCKFLSITEKLVQKVQSRKIVLKRAPPSPKKEIVHKKQRPSMPVLKTTSQTTSQTTSPTTSPLVAATAGRAAAQTSTGLPVEDTPKASLPDVATTASTPVSSLHATVPPESRTGASVTPLGTASVSSSLPASPTIPPQVPLPLSVSDQLPPPLIRKTASKTPRAVLSSSDSSSAIPPKKVKSSLPPPPSQDYRACKLLKLGGMPHWQPARRAWEEDEVVSLVERDLTIFWPPKGWKSLTPQQKLMQWEFAALSIMKARGENYIHIHQADLLDNFNFLALPGTAAHKTPKSLPSYLQVKSRLFNYETLRSIANGDLKDEKWLSMLEAGAMMRDTSNDKLLKTCTNVKLRLVKD
ncbi:MAG: hypothetical protein AB2693_23490 [Candidatus Thiodiazotropha sp.]